MGIASTFALIADSLLKDFKVADAFKFLEEPDSLREAALNIKNKN